jgi:hypothetical protein
MALITNDPERMTFRAQAYLLISGLRHLATGLFLILDADRFQSASFIPIIRTAPLWVWGGLSIAVALLLLGAASWKHEDMARFGLIGSAGLTGMIALGLTIAALTSSVAGVLGAFIYIAVTGKDLVQCLDPLKSPFEGLFRRGVVADDGGQK